MRPGGTDADYLSLLQREAGVKILTDVEILSEYYWPITQVDSSTQFRVAGDATALFVSGSSIQLSTKKFSEIEVIQSVTFSASETIFVLSSGSVSSSDLGARVSRIYRVSDRVLKESLGDVSESIEGSTLNLFQSSTLNCKLDNSDQYFLNAKQSTGILWNGSELLESAAITETQVTFTNCTLAVNSFKGGVLTVLSGNAKNREYPVLSNADSVVLIVGALLTDGAVVGDSFLVSLGIWFSLKFYAGLRVAA